MELYDLVDIEDRVIGETTKEKGHADGGIHRIVAVFVFSPDRKLYVQVHEESEGRLDHSVGGHVSKGEDYDAAAHREAIEELNINCPLSKVSKFYSDETWRGKNVRHMIGLYECIAPLDWKFRETEEVKTLILMDMEAIVKRMNENSDEFTGGFLNTMFEYIKRKNLNFKLKNYNLA